MIRAALSVLLLGGLAAPAALGYAEFRTPHRSAYCGRTEGDATPALLCWTPRDGFTTIMRAHGRAMARHNKLNRGYHNDLAPVLRYGKRWTASGFRCRSRTGGLKCVNRSDHGWWLGSKKGHRIF